MTSCYTIPRSGGRRPPREKEPAIYKQRRIAALVPAFNEAPHVGTVIRTMPPFVDRVIVVDDRSTDATVEAVTAEKDPRVTLIRHDVNQGLGATLIDAHLEAMRLGADVSVVMAGDAQMDPAYLAALLDPIVDDGYDFAKGNRFFSGSSWRGMPRHRVVGNIVLTLLTKAATGYWHIVDPQNGYTAMAAGAQRLVDWGSVARDYSFENDVLAQLGLNGCRIKDVDIPARYGTEVSSIRLAKVVPQLLRTLRRAFWRRMKRKYLARAVDAG